MRTAIGKLNKLLLIAMLGVFCAVAPAQAGNTYVPANLTTATAVIIPDNGDGVTCVGLFNSHPGGLAVYVPADTLIEWQTFLAHMQPYVRLAPCPNCPAGTVSILTNHWGSGGPQNYPAFPPGVPYTVNWSGGSGCTLNIFGVCLLSTSWGPSSATLECVGQQVWIISGTYQNQDLTIAPDGQSGYYIRPSGGSSSGGHGCGNGDVSSGCSDGPQDSQTEETSGDNFGPSQNGGGGGDGGVAGGPVTAMTLP